MTIPVQVMHKGVVGVDMTNKVSHLDRTAVGVHSLLESLVERVICDGDGIIKRDHYELRDLTWVKAPRCVSGRTPTGCTIANIRITRLAPRLQLSVERTFTFYMGASNSYGCISCSTVLSYVLKRYFINMGLELSLFQVLYILLKTFEVKIFYDEIFYDVLEKKNVKKHVLLAFNYLLIPKNF